MSGPDAGEILGALEGQRARGVELQSPGEDEVPRSTTLDYALILVGIAANSAATVIGAVTG